MEIKMFEEKFSELQTELVQRAVDLIGSTANVYYLLGSTGINMQEFDAFFEKEDMLFEKDYIAQYSDDEMFSFLGDSLKLIGEMRNLFIQNNKEVPEELYWTFNYEDSSLAADFKYDTNHIENGLLSEDLLENWMQKISVEKKYSIYNADDTNLRPSTISSETTSDAKQNFLAKFFNKKGK